MVSISSAAQRVKEDPGAVLSREQVEMACAGVKHFFRARKLDPFITIISMVVQVMHGNTAITHVVRLMHDAFNASAFCQARSRLPVEVLLTLLKEMFGRVRGVLDENATPGRWRGHRTLLLDGTGFSMPDTRALVKHFGAPPHQKRGCGFPVGHMVALFDAATGLLLDAVAAAGKAGDITLAADLRGWLRRGDILIGDRAFCSFAHLAVLQSFGVHGLFRLHQLRKDHQAVRRKQRRRRANREQRHEPILVRRISRDDRIVEWLRPTKLAAWLTREQQKQLPRTMQVRVIHFRVHQRGWRTDRVALATTLLDPERYPASELARLYLSRWSIELNLRHLKQTMRMDVLRCKSVAGVRKELATFALVYNLVRLVMLDAAARQGVTCDRVSFIDALRWLQVAEADQAPPLLRINPSRPGRFEPRFVKRRRSSGFLPLTRPRREAKKWLLRKRKR